VAERYEFLPISLGHGNLMSDEVSEVTLGKENDP